MKFFLIPFAVLVLLAGCSQATISKNKTAMPETITNQDNLNIPEQNLNSDQIYLQINPDIITGASRKYNDDLNIFNDDTIGLSFKYPSKWGELTGVLSNNSFYYYRLTFSNDSFGANNISASGCKAPCHTESENVIFSGYNSDNFSGTSFDEVCSTYAGIGCQEIKSGLGYFLSANYWLSSTYEQFLPDGFSLKAFINFPKNKYVGGLAINYSLNSSEFESAIRLIEDTAGCEGDEPEGECVKGVKAQAVAAYENKINQFGNQFKRGKLEEKVQSEVNEFKQFLQTIIIKD